MEVIVIGGGLAGSEAAYYLASRGIKTTLVDMTKLGLVEITRKKVRKPLAEQLR